MRKLLVLFALAFAFCFFSTAQADQWKQITSVADTATASSITVPAAGTGSSTLVTYKQGTVEYKEFPNQITVWYKRAMRDTLDTSVTVSGEISYDQSEWQTVFTASISDTIWHYHTISADSVGVAPFFQLRYALTKKGGWDRLYSRVYARITRN